MSLTNTQAIEILEVLVESLDRKVEDFTRRAGTDRARKASHLVAVAVYRDEAAAVRMALAAFKESRT